MHPKFRAPGRRGQPRTTLCLHLQRAQVLFTNAHSRVYRYHRDCQYISFFTSGRGVGGHGNGRRDVWGVACHELPYGLGKVKKRLDYALTLHLVIISHFTLGPSGLCPVQLREEAAARALDRQTTGRARSARAQPARRNVLGVAGPSALGHEAPLEVLVLRLHDVVGDVRPSDGREAAFAREVRRELLDLVGPLEVDRRAYEPRPAAVVGGIRWVASRTDRVAMLARAARQQHQLPWARLP
eukprot:scaffold11458_cov66-Phaeocystis_antarctica.AAC.3